MQRWNYSFLNSIKKKWSTKEEEDDNKNDDDDIDQLGVHNKDVLKML